MIQHPTVVITPNTIIRQVKMDTIMPFHFPNHHSIKLVNGLSTPECFANLSARVVKDFAMVDCKLGMNVQH
jgi:hypothetical protein